MTKRTGMSIVYLSLGSNLGEREKFIKLAISEIGERIGRVTKISKNYETEPWGFNSTNRFINVAIEVNTQLSPQDVSYFVHKIEEDLGRVRSSKAGYEDRVIDIDILIYDDFVFESETLTLPHPKMHLREFVIDPLCEIAPNLLHPVMGITIKDISMTLKKQ